MRGYVRYTAKPPVPSYVITRGHYVAYFQEAGTWYLADDARVVALDQMPDAFPSICFFERVGAARLPLPQLPPNPTVASRDSVDDAGNAQSEEEEEEGRPSEGGGEKACGEGGGTAGKEKALAGEARARAGLVAVRSDWT